MAKPRQKKTIDLETYSALDAYAICYHEWYSSLRRAGFSVDNALWLLSDRDSFPDWILPIKPLEKISDSEYTDDDE